MTVVVLLILAVIWAAVLVPPALQNRRENRPGDSIASFRDQLHVLERATPGFQPLQRARSVAPRAAPQAAMSRVARPTPSPSVYRRADARRRRRDIFATLLGGVALTFVGAVLMGGVVWGLHLAVDVLFIGYVALLIRLQQQSAEQEMKVRYLPERRPTRSVDAMLRRSATN